MIESRSGAHHARLNGFYRFHEGMTIDRGY